MPNLIIDTTTTGYWQYNQAPTSPNQPHMIGLSAILEEDDGTIRDQMSRIVQLPKGYAVSDGAEQFHGIRTIDVKEHGEPLGDIMTHFVSLLTQATQVVAFNSTHHAVVLDKSFAAVDMERPLPLPPELCMMRLTTGICKIIDRNGNYKWPKLAEAYFYFAKVPLTVDFTSGPRDVMSQRVAAVRRIFHGYQAAKRSEARELARREQYPEDYGGGVGFAAVKLRHLWWRYGEWVKLALKIAVLFFIFWIVLLLVVMDFADVLQKVVTQ